MRCPNCHNRLLQKSADGVRVRITGHVRLDDKGAHTQCYWCKADVTIPLRLHETEPAERFIVRK